MIGKNVSSKIAAMPAAGKAREGGARQAKEASLSQRTSVETFDVTTSKTLKFGDAMMWRKTLRLCYEGKGAAGR